MLNRECQARGLRYLVIGGHAVNAYGIARETADVDLLVNRDDRDAWLNFFGCMAYRVFHDGGNFLQLSPPKEGAWPVDLMLVQKPTFEKMEAESRHVALLNTTVAIPKVEHLIALKLHALKHTRLHRFLKDFLDVVNLIECAKLDATSDEIKALFEKHGTKDLYEKVLRALQKN